MIHVSNFSLNIGKAQILENINLSFPQGKINILIGPNGSGKSTLLKAVTGQLKGSQGEIQIKGKSLNQYSPAQLAKVLSYLPQELTCPPQLTVEQLIEFGRFPFRSRFSKLNDADIKAIDEAIRFTDLGLLRKRKLGSLSGGQKQRAWLAMSLAQEPEILLLDEPTTFLDIKYQLDLLNLLKKLNQEKNLTILMVLHDINLSLDYADNLFVLERGKFVKGGEPLKTLDEDLLKDVFNLKAQKEFLSRSQKYHFVFC